MAGGAYHDDPDVISDINVTPLVDVFLVLLVIFMVTAPLLAARGIMVEQPKTVSGSQVPGTLTLTLDEHLVLYVEKQRYEDRAAARAAIQARRAEDRDLKAVIKADARVPHGEVMAVIDLVNLAGISKFALASAPKAAETGSMPGEDGDDP